MTSKIYQDMHSPYCISTFRVMQFEECSCISNHLVFCDCYVNNSCTICVKIIKDKLHLENHLVWIILNASDLPKCIIAESHSHKTRQRLIFWIEV